MNRRAHTQGFTLLEVLVALTLFGVIATLLLNGVRLGARVWESVRARSSAAEQQRAAHAFLRRELEQAQPVYEPAERGGRRIGFIGTEDMLRFVAPFPDYLQQGGLYRFTLQVREREGLKRLVAAVEPYPGSDRERSGGEEPDNIPLYDDVERVEFAYFGEQRGTDGAGWHANWIDGDRLPRLVRIGIRTREAGGGLDLLIAPKADAADVPLVPGETFPGQE